MSALLCHRCLSGVLAALTLLACPALAEGANAASRTGEITPLKSIASTLSTQETDPLKRHTVTLRGVVTYRSNALTGDDYFIIEDASGGLKVDIQLAQKRYVWRDHADSLAYLEDGLSVEVEGTIEPAPLTPSILPSNIRILSPKPVPLPGPLRQGPLSVMRGTNMLRRVQISGVVHSATQNANGLRIRVETAIGAYFLAQIPNTEDLQAPLIENAAIQLTGVAVPILNAQDGFIRPLLLVSNEKDVVIITPPPLDPFAVPKAAISDFSGFAPTIRNLHRIQVTGSVTYWEPGSLLYLQDHNRSIRIVTDSFDSVKIGDIVEASGFIESLGVVGELRRARIRKVGEDSPLSPIFTNPSSVVSDSSGALISASENMRQHDGLLVQVSGRLLRTQHSSNPGSLQLILDTGKSLTSAILRHPNRDADTRALENLRLGSLLSVTGVATVEYNFPQPNEDFPSPARLDVLLRSPTDVSLLEHASWWTLPRLAYFLGSFGVLLSASLVWTLVLRHMVLRRCKRLEEGLRKHRDSELEFKAAQQERQRLAADLHDGIQQLIAGAAFRLEAATAHLEHTPVPPAAQEQLSATRTALISAQTSIRNFLSGSSSIEENTSDFAALIAHTFRNVAQWPANATTVETLGATFPLSRNVMGSLLLLLQEAVSNALKHGSASRVDTRLIYKDETLEIRVEDNGSGFDTSSVPGKIEGHFGLDSMRQRMRWLGGSVDIQSTEKTGTCVRIRLPRSRSKATRRLRAV